MNSNSSRFPMGESLLCPSCGGDNLHQMRVEVYSRFGEDKGGVRVVVERASVSSDEAMDSNPSPRRNGIRILFCCETCAEMPTLTIAQHKGTEYMRWQLPPDSKELRAVRKYMEKNGL